MQVSEGGRPVPVTMQALVVLGPSRMEIRDVPVPVPGPNEILARVRAVSICGTDVHLIRGDYPGFWPPAFPFIPGHEWAGEIVELGPGVELHGWKVGDRVAGTSHDACGVPEVRRGPLQPAHELRQARPPQAVRPQRAGRGRHLRRPGREDDLPAPRRPLVRRGRRHRPSLHRPPRGEPGPGRSRRHRRDHGCRRDRPPRWRRGPDSRRGPRDPGRAQRWPSRQGRRHGLRGGRRERR